MRYECRSSTRLFVYLQSLFFVHLDFVIGYVDAWKTVTACTVGQMWDMTFIFFRFSGVSRGGDGSSPL